MDTKSVEKKTDEDIKLAEIEELRVQIEKRLIKLASSTDNVLCNLSTNLDANDRGTGDPIGDAYEMALQAERATTVKSFLPKFLNLFLRKQNIVNRRLIAAIRSLAESIKNSFSRIEKCDSRIEVCDSRIEMCDSRIEVCDSRIEMCDSRIEVCDHGISALEQSISQNKEKISELHYKINNLTFANSNQEFLPTQSSIRDHFYYEFTNRFRGSYELISKRLSFYLKILERHFDNKTMKGMLALDLGFGRGEWLDMMKEKSVCCVGVDSNKLFFNDCKSRNLEVRHIDILDALGETADETYDLISAFHVVEHFDVNIQLHFFSELFRVLKKGGMIFIETPYNGNLDVGATGFYHDPTHVRPLHEDLGKFIIEYLGFSHIETHHLNPDDLYENDNSVKSRISGPRDLAIIAQKTK
mgnify:CR=1 FL=1